MSLGKLKNGRKIRLKQIWKSTYGNIQETLLEIKASEKNLKIKKSSLILKKLKITKSVASLKNEGDNWKYPFLKQRINEETIKSDVSYIEKSAWLILWSICNDVIWYKVENVLKKGKKAIQVSLCYSFNFSVSLKFSLKVGWWKKNRSPKEKELTWLRKFKVFFFDKLFLLFTAKG